MHICTERESNVSSVTAEWIEEKYDQANLWYFMSKIRLGHNAENPATEQEHYIRLSPTIPPIQLSPNVLFTIFYYLPLKDFSSYNSFSPTIPPISISSIYYHSLTNYLFNIFELKKSYSICTVIIHIIIMLRGSNEINIVKKQCN